MEHLNKLNSVLLLLLLGRTCYGEEISFEIEGCRTEGIDMEYFCPIVRYCEWDTFTATHQKFLKKEIGYKESEWNYEEISEIETTHFMGLDEEIQIKLEMLDYDEDKHDCCLGHYEDYDWIDFDPDDGFGETLAALELLGYNEELWEEGIEIEYDDMWWDELPLDIIHVLHDMFCYTRELWNEVTIPDWPIDADIPGSFRLENSTFDLENNTTEDSDLDNNPTATSIAEETNQASSSNTTITIGETNFVFAPSTTSPDEENNPIWIPITARSINDNP